MASRHFDISLGCLISPALDELATQLVFVAGLSPSERDVIVRATRESVYPVVHSKVSRLLVLELNAARELGRLNGEDSDQRWQHFLELSSQHSFWNQLANDYPPLLARIKVTLQNRCRAALRFGERWAGDRARLSNLFAVDPGELQELSFGAGDSHLRGLTVARLRAQAGRIIYKPRSVAIDIALRNFINELANDHGKPLSIGVPKAVDCGEYGWAEFIPHRHATSEEELRRFYRGIGHLLAAMRLLGGTDLHAGNIIACAGSPVIVDCETLFTPKMAPSPSGYGDALDRAASRAGNTVLNAGLLPGRGGGLGWRGVDPSGVGNLPGQQPIQSQPEILYAGSDQARVGTVLVKAPMSQNHPSPQPALGEYWPEVLEGFDELTTTLQRLDRDGTLRSRLHSFKNCRIRVVLRATEVYAELGRMLWHPVSLHKPEPARERASELLKRMAANASRAPSDTAVINAEVEDLLESDIPCFVTTAGDGRLQGPRGTHWLPARDLVETALENWRNADLALERNVIQASLVSAYMGERPIGDRAFLLAKQGRGGDLDMRRRRLLAQIIDGIVRNAIHGDDGTVAWIAPVLDPTGWSVQPLYVDVYNGISGIALLLGAYLHEAAARRAEPIDGLDKLLAAVSRTLRLVEAKREALRSEGIKIRPLPPGGYFGLGSQIWTYLALAYWELDGGDGVQRACKLAEEIPTAAAADETNDLISGIAGAITPLLVLARKAGDERYVSMASQLGDLLYERAQHRNGAAYWTDRRWPEGLGGFGHGVTGIGWALTRLARVTGSVQHHQLAQKAFAFENALFDEEEQNWLDLRKLEGLKTFTAWCHGAVGIGLAHLDLDPTLAQASAREIVRRAAAATWRSGVGRNHCACHGDLSAWELLDRAIAVGEAPKELSASYLLDIILTSLEQHGPYCGMGRNVFVPGLLPGVGGIAYQLLRFHPDHDVPAILTLSEDEL